MYDLQTVQALGMHLAKSPYLMLTEGLQIECLSTVSVCLG